MGKRVFTSGDRHHCFEARGFAASCVRIAKSRPVIKEVSPGSNFLGHKSLPLSHRGSGDLEQKPSKTFGGAEAIQLACAAAAGMDLFITNDDRLSRKRVPEIKFITSLQRAPI